MQPCPRTPHGWHMWDEAIERCDACGMTREAAQRIPPHVLLPDGEILMAREI